MTVVSGLVLLYATGVVAWLRWHERAELLQWFLVAVAIFGGFVFRAGLRGNGDVAFWVLLGLTGVSFPWVVSAVRSGPRAGEKGS